MSIHYFSPAPNQFSSLNFIAVQILCSVGRTLSGRQYSLSAASSGKP
ncbi:hypothetical protein ACTTAI_14480 [Rhodobacter capsulatus]